MYLLKQSGSESRTDPPLQDLRDAFRFLQRESAAGAELVASSLDFNVRPRRQTILEGDLQDGILDELLRYDGLSQSVPLLEGERSRAIIQRNLIDDNDQSGLLSRDASCVFLGCMGVPTTVAYQHFIDLGAGILPWGYLTSEHIGATYIGAEKFYPRALSEAVINAWNPCQHRSPWFAIKSDMFRLIEQADLPPESLIHLALIDEHVIPRQVDQVAFCDSLRKRCLSRTDIFCSGFPIAWHERLMEDPKIQSEFYVVPGPTESQSTVTALYRSMSRPVLPDLECHHDLREFIIRKVLLEPKLGRAWRASLGLAADLKDLKTDIQRS